MAFAVGGMYWRRNDVLLHTCLLQSGTYWRYHGVNQWDSLRANLRFCEPFGGLIRKLSDLGFGHCALACMPLAVGGTHYRHGGMLLRICHSPWVAYIVLAVWVCSSVRVSYKLARTGDMVVCSCVHVTCRG